MASHEVVSVLAIIGTLKLYLLAKLEGTNLIGSLEYDGRIVCQITFQVLPDGYLMGEFHLACQVNFMKHLNIYPQVNSRVPCLFKL